MAFMIHIQVVMVGLVVPITATNKEGDKRLQEDLSGNSNLRRLIIFIYLGLHKISPLVLAKELIGLNQLVVSLQHSIEAFILLVLLKIYLRKSYVDTVMECGNRLMRILVLAVVTLSFILLIVLL